MMTLQADAEKPAASILQHATPGTPRMAGLKTKPNAQNVVRFLSSITDKRHRQDCLTVLEVMKKVTKAEPQMWGSSTAGFGRQH